MTRHALAALAALSSCALPAPFLAAVCGPADGVMGRLASVAGQKPVASGPTADGAALVVVLASPDGATWSVVALTPDGRACVIAAGTDWQTVAPPPGEPA